MFVSLSSRSKAKCFARTWFEENFVSVSSSAGVTLSAVVSHRPGYAVSVPVGRNEVDVRGGICREIDTLGVRVTEAILEDDMLV